jgi:hypothetical protein
MFLGKAPPRGYQANPAGLFLLPTDPKPASRERRRHHRRDAHVRFRLVHAQGEAPALEPAEEQTVAENLGKRGARVPTSLMVVKGDVLIVEEQDGGAFRTRAEIKNVYLGPDNVPRLNLYFLDEEAPDRLVSAS